MLMSVVSRDGSNVNYHIMKALLEHGAPVNATASDGRTALMIAARAHHKLRVRYIELLCDYGADVDLKGRDGRNALRYAAKWGGFEDHAEVKRILQHASQEGHEKSLPSNGSRIKDKSKHAEIRPAQQSAENQQSASATQELLPIALQAPPQSSQEAASASAGTTTTLVSNS